LVVSAKRSKAERRAVRKSKPRDRDEGPVEPEVSVTKVIPENQAEIIHRMTGAYPPETE